MGNTKIPVINDQSQQSCNLSVKEREHLLASLKARKIKTKKYPTLKKIKLGMFWPVDA
jgi:hypothetical protein